MDWKAQPARTWLVVGLVVALAHAGAWIGFDRLRDKAASARAFKVIEAALLPPPAPAPRLLPVAPPAPKKPVPKPMPRIEPQRPQPAPLPLTTPIESAEPPPVRIVAAPAAPEPISEPTPIAPPTVAPAAPPPPPAIEAPRFNAAYLNNPPPEYPPAARRRGDEGRVLVRAEVLADGRCTRVELKQGSGHALLDQAALEAVRKWRFVPARQGEQAVNAWVDVPIAFRLKN